MKTLKILLSCTIFLLVIGIVLLVTDIKRSSSESPYSPDINSDYYSGYDDVDPEIYPDHSDKNVMCKACNGHGENSYEVGGRNTCSVCNGKKWMPESEMLRRYNKWLKEEIECFWCNGTGLSYKARTIDPNDWILNAPPHYYDCKICQGKRKGTRKDLIKHFSGAEQFYGCDL